jgi:hypothetical protein
MDSIKIRQLEMVVHRSILSRILTSIAPLNGNSSLYLHVSCSVRVPQDALAKIQAQAGRRANNLATSHPNMRKC